MGSLGGNLLEKKVKRTLAIIKKIKIENKKRELWLKEGDKNANFIFFSQSGQCLKKKKFFGQVKGEWC